MSIIADTLKRLQAQANDSSPKPKEDAVQRPALNKGEGSGRHRKDSPFTFLLVMVGMTITLGGLAIATFWIGGYLDFGLGTTSQARVNDHRSLPRPLDRSNDPAILEHTAEPSIPAVSETAQGTKSASSVSQGDQMQASKKFKDRASPKPSSPPRETAPSQFEVKTIGTPSTTTIVPITPPDQPSLSGQRDQQHKDQGEKVVLSSSTSGEPSSVMISPTLPTERMEDHGIDMIVVGQEDEEESQDLLAMLSEEEIIQTGELVQPSSPPTNSAPRAITLAALKAQRESKNHAAVPLVSLQPSPAHRLSHAQELIRAGEYEDAVSLLSPLFHEPPVKWQPWFWMGTALLGKGDMKEADQFFLSGLARNDKIPQLWIQRALVAQQRGDYQLAIHELRQAESLAADLPHIHLNMGYAYEQLGNDRMANQYYGKFLKLSENQPSFFSTRKKLFARLTQQSVPEKKSSSSPPSSEP